MTPERTLEEWAAIMAAAEKETLVRLVDSMTLTPGRFDQCVCPAEIIDKQDNLTGRYVFVLWKSQDGELANLRTERGTVTRMEKGDFIVVERREELIPNTPYKAWKPVWFCLAGVPAESAAAQKMEGR